MVILKEFFEKVDFEKICRRQKSIKNFRGGRLNILSFDKKIFKMDKQVVIIRHLDHPFTLELLLLLLCLQLWKS